MDIEDIVTLTAEIYAELNESGHLIKPASSLPAPVDEVRKAFMDSYRHGYGSFTEEIKDSYHHVYRELSYFLEEPYYTRFEESLEVLIRSRIATMASKGIKEDEQFLRSLLVGYDMRLKNRQEIIDSFRFETACPPQELRYIVITMFYLTERYRVFWDEWSSYANYIAALSKDDVDFAKSAR